jgi:hypothetical protein
MVNMSEIGASIAMASAIRHVIPLNLARARV